MTKQIFAGYSKKKLLDIRKQQSTYRIIDKTSFCWVFKVFILLDIQSKLGVTVPLFTSLREVLMKEADDWNMSKERVQSN